MVSGVSSGGGAYAPQPSSGSSHDQAIIKQMQQYEAELRHDMGPPVNYVDLQRLLPQMENFLNQNKGALETIMEKNGYFIGGPFSISAEFEGAISSLKTYLSHPNGASLDLLNESITQINYYLNTKNPGH